MLKKGVSNRTVGLALLAVGLAIGAGLVITLNLAYDVLTPHTVTTTWTETSIVVIKVPGTFTTTTVFAQVEASATSCAWSGSHEYCEIVLKNSGNMVTTASGNCTLSYGGREYAGFTGPTQAYAASPGAPQQLVPGISVTTYCQGATGGAAGAGIQVTGSIFLAYGTEVGFTANASS